MIEIDTEQLNQMVSVLESANSSIDSAVSLLQQVTEHHDWGCKERHSINDSISENRKKIQQIQQDSDTFYQNLRKVAGEFVETEEGISALFPSVESALQVLLSMGVGGGAAAAAGTAVADVLKNASTVTGGCTLTDTAWNAGKSAGKAVSQMLGNQNWSNPIGKIADTLTSIDPSSLLM